jgi:hypothetical protein
MSSGMSPPSLLTTIETWALFCAGLGSPQTAAAFIGLFRSVSNIALSSS